MCGARPRPRYPPRYGSMPHLARGWNLSNAPHRDLRKQGIVSLAITPQRCWPWHTTWRPALDKSSTFGTLPCAAVVWLRCSVGFDLAQSVKKEVIALLRESDQAVGWCAGGDGPQPREERERLHSEPGGVQQVAGRAVLPLRQQQAAEEGPHAPQHGAAPPPAGPVPAPGGPPSAWLLPWQP